jgi:hypothetical protein
MSVFIYRSVDILLSNQSLARGWGSQPKKTFRILNAHVRYLHISKGKNGRSDGLGSTLRIEINLN